MIDLHCHSYFSDGLHSPELLLKKALSAGVRMLALTDHDTMAGLKRLRKAAAVESAAPVIISGIELSTRWKKQDIHIIGLQVSEHESGLEALIQQQQKRRKLRSFAIAERLQAVLGLSDVYQKACDVAGHEWLARPHFAQVLINEGVTQDIQSGFKRYLGRGRPAYIETNWVGVEEAVSAIIKAGGHAVIAHPLKYDLSQTKLNTLITLFKAAGGAALEVVSGDTTRAQSEMLAGFCQRYDLLASSGSDFHGDLISRTPLGAQPQLPLNCTPLWQPWFME